MIRRYLEPALDTCSSAVRCGRSPAQAGSRCKEEHDHGVRFTVVRLEPA